jgi:aspartate racemase
MKGEAMRTIGLLGGMSWMSTAEYYKILNQLAAGQGGGLHSAPLLLHSFDFAEIAALQAAGRWNDAGDLLAGAAKGQEAAGAELLLIGTNTMHKVAPAVQAAVSVPLVHIIDATAERARAAGLTTLGLLGSSFTMEDGFYQQRMAADGLRVLVPGEADRRAVHRIIFGELCAGVISEASRQAYRQIIARLAAAGAEGVILGCTEIELLIGRADSPVQVLPTTQIHAEAAIAAATSPRPIRLPLARRARPPTTSRPRCGPGRRRGGGHPVRPRRNRAARRHSRPSGSTGSLRDPQVKTPAPG